MALFPAPGGNDPRSRMTALVGALGIVLISMYSCHKYSKPVAGTLPDDSPPMVVADERATVDQPLKGIRTREHLGTTHILDFVSNDDQNRYRAQNLDLIRVALEEGFGWLKGQSHAEMQRLAWPRGRWSHAKVMQHPDRWRMNVLHVYGMLLHHEVIELTDMPAGMGKLHKLILFNVRNHHAFTVLTPLMPADAHALAGTQEGSYLACDGLFIMRYPYLSNSGWKPTPLVLAKRVTFARERQTVPTRLDPRGDPGVDYAAIQPQETVDDLNVLAVQSQILAPPKDGSGFRHPGAMDYHLAASDIVQEKPAFDHLFQYIYSLSDEEIAGKINPEVTYRSLMQGNAAPKWMTGKFTRFKGLASFVKTYDFPDAENGITRIHLLVGHDTRLRGPDFTWVLACLNLPENLHADDEIEADGIFVKLYPYRSVEGKWHWAPLIVCKEIKRIDTSDQGRPTTAYVVIGIAVLLLVGGVYWAGQRDTSDLEAVRQRVLARRIEHDKKTAGKGLPGKTSSPENKATGDSSTDSSPDTPSGSDDGEEDPPSSA